MSFFTQLVNISADKVITNQLNALSHQTFVRDSHNELFHSGVFQLINWIQKSVEWPNDKSRPQLFEGLKFCPCKLSYRLNWEPVFIWPYVFPDSIAKGNKSQRSWRTSQYMNGHLIHYIYIYMYLYDYLTLSSKFSLKNMWQAPNKIFGSSKSWLVKVLFKRIKTTKWYWF